MPNKTNWQHGAIALVVQHVFVLVGSLVTLSMNSPWAGYWSSVAGALAASSFFLGREHAQREYKIGDPSRLVGHEAFDFHNWTQDEKLDLLFPVAATWGASFGYALYVILTGAPQ